MDKAFYYDFSLNKYSVFDYTNFSLERKEYIESIKDFDRKEQSYYVWLLLLYALRKFNVDIANSTFSQRNGKWFIENSNVCFSLSHSKNIVAVAVSSSNNVGIDVQVIEDKVLNLKKKFNSNSSDRVLLTDLWCKKECEIKCDVSRFYNSIIVEDKLNNSYVIGTVNVDKKNIVKITSFI